MPDPFHIAPEDWQALRDHVQDIHDALLGTMDGRVQGMKYSLTDHERRLTVLEDSKKWTRRNLADKFVAAIVGFVVAYIGSHGGPK